MKIRNRFTGKELLEISSLSGANLRGADLRGADLRGADLNFCIGNMLNIKSLQLELWAVTYTSTHIQIGCQNHLIQDWLKLSDDEIREMDQNAFEWWVKWKDFIFNAIELSPAKPTK